MWFVALLGCEPAPLRDSEPIEVAVDPVGTVSFEITTATSIELVLRGEADLAVNTVTGPDGVELAYAPASDEQITNAVLQVPGETVLVWPVVPGAYQVEVGAFDALGEPVSAELQGRLLYKTGYGRRLPVTLKLSEGVELPEAAERRLTRVLRRAGWKVELMVESADLPPVAPGFDDDPELFATIADAEGLVVWLAEEAPVTGLSGNIPVSTLPGPRSLAVISAGHFTGPDGTYEESDANALGDTIAHELGHQLGLFHPVELSLDRFDALDDTPRCGDLDECEALLGENLMYPLARWEGLPSLSVEQKLRAELHPAIE